LPDGGGPLKTTSLPGSSAYIFLLAGVGALGGLLFGYDTAVISGAVGFLQRHFHLNAGLTGWAASSVLVGCMIGAMAGGPLGDRFGRKPLILASALLFALSGILTAVAATLDHYVLARLLGGVAIGAIIVSVNLLIQRQGSPEWNAEYGWRWMFGSLSVPAVVLTIMSLLIPESPRWLMSRGRRDASREILVRIGSEQEAENGLREMEQSLAQESGTLAELFAAAYRRPLLIGAALAVFCQFSEINAIMYYAPEIFKSSGAGLESSFLQTLLIGLVNLVFTVVAIRLIDRAGRRPLQLGGALVQVIALTAVGVAFARGLGGLFLLLPILLFIAAFASGRGPVPWGVISEVFPMRIRGSAMAVAMLIL